MTQTIHPRIRWWRCPSTDHDEPNLLHQTAEGYLWVNTKHCCFLTQETNRTPAGLKPVWPVIMACENAMGIPELACVVLPVLDVYLGDELDSQDYEFALNIMEDDDYTGIWERSFASSFCSNMLNKLRACDSIIWHSTLLEQSSAEGTPGYSEASGVWN